MAKQGQHQGARQERARTPAKIGTHRADGETRIRKSQPTGRSGGKSSRRRSGTRSNAG